MSLCFSYASGNKLAGVDFGRWEQLAENHRSWHHAVKGGVMKGNKKLNQLLEIRRLHRKQREQS